MAKQVCGKGGEDKSCVLSWQVTPRPDILGIEIGQRDLKGKNNATPLQTGGRMGGEFLELHRSDPEPTRSTVIRKKKEKRKGNPRGSDVERAKQQREGGEKITHSWGGGKKSLLGESTWGGGW